MGPNEVHARTLIAMTAGVHLRRKNGTGNRNASGRTAKYTMETTAGPSQIRSVFHFILQAYLNVLTTVYCLFPQPATEKKIPDAPKPRIPPTPSAPRAMASGIGSGERNSKGEISSGRDRHRDGRDQPKGPPPNAPTAPDPSRAPNSLRSRISEKDFGLLHSPPQGPGGYRGGESSSRRDDDRDGSGRKRTASGEC